MVDIHTHIIPHVDDGAIDINESIEILKQAKQAGYDDIVATSHYIEGSYDANIDRRNELLLRIKNELKKQNIDIRLYLGNEIFITENIFKLINENKISTMNNTKYLLIELPRNSNVTNLQSYIFDLFNNGFVPIIAHPERYNFVKQNPNSLIQYIDQGALFQSNTRSLTGFYGKEAQKTVEILLECNMIDFLATDSHRANNTSYLEIPEVEKKLHKLIGIRQTIKLMDRNPRMMLNNEDITIEEPIEYRKRKFFFFGR